MRVALVSALIVMVSGLTASRSTKPDNDLISLRDLHAPMQYRQSNDAIGARIQLAQQYDNRCFTPSFWCYLPQNYPVNIACWCATPYGPVQGIVK